MRNQVSDQASSWRHLKHRSFNVEELNVSFRWTLVGQPKDYKHGDDSYVLSSGLMLDGCHSTSGEPQSANPPHHGRWCWDRLIIARWCTTSLRSDSNQNFCLAYPKLPRLLAAAGPWSSQCAACMAPSCMNIAGPAAGGCQGLTQPECWGPRQIPPSGYVCPGFGPKTVFNYGKGTTTPWRKLIRRHIVAEHRQDGDAYRGLLWRPQGSPYRAYLARTPPSVLSGISKIRPMAAAFITATEVPTTHHGRASVVLIVAVSRKYCQLNATDGRNLRATVS